MGSVQSMVRGESGVGTGGGDSRFGVSSLSVWGGDTRVWFVIRDVSVVDTPSRSLWM